MLDIGFRFGVPLLFAKRFLESFRHMRQTFFFLNGVSVVNKHITHQLVTLTLTISNESCITEFAFLDKSTPYQFSSSWFHRLAGTCMVDSTVGFVTIKPF